MASNGGVAAQDAGRGADLFQKECAVCHTFTEGYNKEGPSLAGVWGRKAGTVPYFGGYQALKSATFVWNEKTLNAWLEDPRAMSGGKDTKMTVRIADASERADLISYLKKAGSD